MNLNILIKSIVYIYIQWGLGIGDWGLGPIPNPQSPIPNPQSPIPINKTLIKRKLKIKNNIFE